VRRFPPHQLYVEAFLGGGACLRFKTPALRSIGIDADGAVIERWRRVAWPGLELVRADAIGWLKDATKWLPPDALVYIDAPYLHETRSSKKRYRVELKPHQHRDLLLIACNLPCSVMVSHYAHPMYEELLADWNHASFPTMTRGGVRTEHLWWRSSLASAGVGTRYIGPNFRENERVRRKVRRWREKFLAMPEAERSAVLASLLHVASLASSGEPAGEGPDAGAGEDDVGAL
jgi:hypothetical protein